MIGVGFYSTYEELKLASLDRILEFISLFLQYLWGIETLKNDTPVDTGFMSFYSTYEELKLLNTISFVIDRIGFYSTYEELKRKLWM